MPPSRLRAACLVAGLAIVAPSVALVHAGEERTDRALARSDAPFDFSAIVARTGGAVVAVQTRQIVLPELPAGLPEAVVDRLRERGDLRPRIGRGTGSGFFVSRDGHIVTNHHVIDQTTEIEVVLDDGTTHPADLVGTDPATDLAVLRIDPSGFGDETPVVAAWGDSDALARGSWTIAVGSPFGLGGTVTVGVLSARQRDLDTGPHGGFLQTDAAINVGNSGGPLFNVEGQVVGVNTAIFSPTGAHVGIGFAVPSNTAEQVVRQLIETGAVRRGHIGLELQDLDDVMARAFGYDRDGGALVDSIEPGSPAEAAGLRPGDVVVGIEGQDIMTARDLVRAVADKEPGAEVTLGYRRDGAQAETVTLALAEAPRPEMPALDLVEAQGDMRLGLTLRPLTEELRAGMGPDAPGVLVRGVRPGGLGAERGIRAGDLIVEAGRMPVREAADVAAAWDAAKAEKRPLLLQIRRADALLYVAVEG
jgi:serine protease Do